MRFEKQTSVFLKMFKIHRSNSIVSILCLISSLLFVQATAPSPKASTDLICHTNHASECYPRTFQPTKKFQIVHDDQTLPPGLHIRMNLATGVKEAKLNEPDPEEETHAAGLSIIDDVPHGPPDLQDQSNPNHFVPFDRPPPFDPSESSLFASSLDILMSSPKDPNTVVSALSDLEDLAHSHYWGLNLARDPSLSHILFQFIYPSASPSQSSLEIRSATTLLLATAIHNNPTALTAALAHFYNDEWPTGPLEAVVLALAHEQLPSLLNRMMFLLSALCQDETQLLKFVKSGGLDLLAQVFNADNIGDDGKDRLRGKIANFMLDRLLQFDPSTGEHAYDVTMQKGNQENPEDVADFGSDDSWVMINKKILPTMPTAADQQPLRITHIFKPWCSLFEKSSHKMSGQNDDDFEAARARENIEKAYIALEKKSSFYGCGCQEDCESQSSR